MEKENQIPSSSQVPASILQSVVVRDAVLTAFSLTGSLSAATVLCSSLVDDELPEAHQAAAVLARLHQIAMHRPKH
ncbi:MAG: hypothetical protein ACPHEQ_00925 [Arenicellales bacterium]